LASQQEALADHTGIADLSANGTYGYREVFGRLGPTPSFSGGLTLTVPLFAGFANVDARQAASQLTRASREDLANSVLGVHQAVSEAYQEIAGARAQVPAAELAERVAQENETQAEGRYRAGVGSIIEVSGAQAQYAAARAATVRARMAYGLAVADLLHAVGRIALR
ncbi:MAG: TolC family protein, partial [Cyanobacteria bacterium REEB65]|nr:TolC family protein [Cyanobacteria bacterium REEB65]